MFSKIVVAASMASAALALPHAAPSTGEYSSFTMIAVHSGDIDVHLRSIVANGESFWIGKETAAYCPEVSDIDCTPYPGNTTVVAAGTTPGSASMSVVAPGGQQVYVAPDGTVGYTIAHSVSKPDGSVVTPFTYTPPATEGSVGQFEGPGGWYACPNGTPGQYQIKSAVSSDLSFDGCTGIAIGATPTDQTNAWEYT